MEKSQRDDNKKRMLSGSVITILLLVVVVIAAVVTFGFDNSFAISDINIKTPKKVETVEPGDLLIGVGGMYADPPVRVAVSFSPYYVYDKELGSNSKYPVFNLEHNREFKPLTSYEKSDAITDYGLLYLMANVYPNVEFDSFLDENLQTWISQVAIWMYLYEKELTEKGTVTEDSPNYIMPDEIASIKETAGVSVYGGDVTYTANPATGGKTDGYLTLEDFEFKLYDLYIKNRVEEALAINGERTYDLNVDFKSDVSISEDEKYYVTSLVSVISEPLEKFSGYRLIINDAPEGTYVQDADGNKIDGVMDFGPTDKFHFVVPVDKITETNKTIKFSVIGTFNDYGGYYYKSTADNGGPVITSVNVTNKRLEDSGEIALNYTPVVPDTGMSIAQVVYFIGLIILFSGVGIIYTNVKAKEN